MNDFAVELIPAAEDELAAAWLRSPDRAAVARADAAAHQLLRTDPLGNGTAVAEGLYRLAVVPLIYYYSVDLTRRHVEVSAIRELRS